jgi:hypothetical protein
MKKGGGEKEKGSSKTSLFYWSNEAILQAGKAAHAVPPGA